MAVVVGTSELIVEMFDSSATFCGVLKNMADARNPYLAFSLLAVTTEPVDVAMLIAVCQQIIKTSTDSV
jgi:hypothetical protein